MNKNSKFILLIVIFGMFLSIRCQKDRVTNDLEVQPETFKTGREYDAGELLQVITKVSKDCSEEEAICARIKYNIQDKFLYNKVILVFMRKIKIPEKYSYTSVENDYLKQNKEYTVTCEFSNPEKNWSQKCDLSKL